ncbi:unnamed protein product, partial [Ectocarpus sp. 12 AP-2014]
HRQLPGLPACLPACLPCSTCLTRTHVFPDDSISLLGLNINPTSIPQTTSSTRQCPPLLHHRQSLPKPTPGCARAPSPRSHTPQVDPFPPPPNFRTAWRPSRRGTSS